MSQTDDTAALIAEAQQQIAEWDRRYLASHGARVQFVALAADLAAALERAQADAARMREASGALLRAVDDYGVKHWDVDDFPPLVQAIVDASHEVRRAALEPRP